MSNSNIVKTRSKIGRWLAFLIVLGLVGAYGLMTLRKNVGSDKPKEIADYVAWDQKVLDVSRNIALQDGGRIKPFSTWSGFAMLELYGTRKMKITANGEEVTLKPEAVLLDCLFRPELASELPLFRIDNDEVISSLAHSSIPEDIRKMIGMTELAQEEEVAAVLEGKGKRDRYSYNELKPLRGVIFTKARKINDDQASKSDMNAEQRRTVDLNNQMNFFLTLTRHFDFAKADLEVNEESLMIDKADFQRVSLWLKAMPWILDSSNGIDPTSPGLSKQFSALERRLESGMFISMMPPYEAGEDEWTPIGERFKPITQLDFRLLEPLVNDVSLLENAFIALRETGQSGFADKLSIWKQSVHSRMDAATVDMLGSEVKYVKNNYFLNALVIFLFASLIVMVSWLSPQSKASRILSWIAALLSTFALVVMIGGIVHRCIIMDRSPIGNLYDTIIFIGTTGVFVLLLVELMTKRMVALGLAVFMGLICMFLARRYEVGDGKDHMDPLVAVLKSNFWLSTHVVTVTIGYMGGLVTSGLSIIYIFARVLGIDEGDKDFRKAMTRIVYGMIAFTLFFSLIGTVLGGIWANDSWGRFWGWDPKENGALMIVLWCLALLHARLAGYLKEWGLHIASVITAMIVAFSWWHVNAMATGLHSYGFIEGIGAIWGFYTLMGVVIVIASIAAFVTRPKKTKKINS